MAIPFAPLSQTTAAAGMVQAQQAMSGAAQAELARQNSARLAATTPYAAVAMQAHTAYMHGLAQKLQLTNPLAADLVRATIASKNRMSMGVVQKAVQNHLAIKNLEKSGASSATILGAKLAYNKSLGQIKGMTISTTPSGTMITGGGQTLSPSMRNYAAQHISPGSSSGLRPQVMQTLQGSATGGAPGTQPQYSINNLANLGNRFQPATQPIGQAASRDTALPQGEQTQVPQVPQPQATAQTSTQSQVAPQITSPLAPSNWNKPLDYSTPTNAMQSASIQNQRSKIAFHDKFRGDGWTDTSSNRLLGQMGLKGRFASQQKMRIAKDIEAGMTYGRTVRATTYYQNTPQGATRLAHDLNNWKTDPMARSRLVSLAYALTAMPEVALALARRAGASRVGIEMVKEISKANFGGHMSAWFLQHGGIPNDKNDSLLMQGREEAQRDFKLGLYKSSKAIMSDMASARQQNLHKLVMSYFPDDVPETAMTHFNTTHPVPHAPTVSRGTPQRAMASSKYSAATIAAVAKSRNKSVAFITNQINRGG